MSADIVQHPFLGKRIGNYICVDCSTFVKVNKQIIFKDLDPYYFFIKKIFKYYSEWKKILIAPLYF